MPPRKKPTLLAQGKPRAVGGSTRPWRVRLYAPEDGGTKYQVMFRAPAGEVTSVEVTTAHSDEVPVGEVISQTPGPGSGQKGDTVELTRSLGPVLVTVPNVRAMGVRAAEQVMRDAGFRTRVQAAAVNYIGVGFVVSTDPKARSQAPKGSTITLFVV